MSTSIATNLERFTLTRYWGGDDLGTCLQVTGPNCDEETGYIGLTREEAGALARELSAFASGEEKVEDGEAIEAKVASDELPPKDSTWEEDDLIQISPAWDPRFGGAILVVDKVRSWGVRGYVVVPDSKNAGLAYYRLPYVPGKPGVEYTGRKVGRAFWLFGSDG